MRSITIHKNFKGSSKFQEISRRVLNSRRFPGVVDTLHCECRLKSRINVYLHGNGKVILSFRWKENVDGFLGERLIALRRLSDLDHM